MPRVRSIPLKGKVKKGTQFTKGNLIKDKDLVRIPRLASCQSLSCATYQALVVVDALSGVGRVDGPPLVAAAVVRPVHVEAELLCRQSRVQSLQSLFTSGPGCTRVSAPGSRPSRAARIRRDPRTATRPPRRP